MCKYAEYGNCDPETKDQEYCLFHKPNKTEEEAERFYQKILKKYQPKEEELEEDVIVDRLGEKIKRYVFETEVNFRGYVFPASKKFATFFNHAMFKNAVCFTNAKFEGPVFFVGTEFDGPVIFIGTVFMDTAFFWKTKFKSLSHFVGAKFWNNAEFIYTTFEIPPSFAGAIFKGEAIFDGVKFGRGGKFTDSVNFYDATFKDKVVFNNVTFKHDVYFSSTIIRNIWFKKDCSVEDPMFYGEVSFHGAKIDKIDIDLRGKCFRLPSAEAEVCRVLRLFYEREGMRDRADEVFVRERRALRRNRVFMAKKKVEEISGKSNWLSLVSVYFLFLVAVFSSWIEYLLADLPSRYGTSWKRPVVLWLINVLIVFPMLYLVTGSIAYNYSDALSVNDFWTAIYFSVVTATTLGYGDFHPVGALGRIIASIEAVYGMFMWTVFLTVYARKYMR